VCAGLSGADLRCKPRKLGACTGPSRRPRVRLVHTCESTGRRPSSSMSQVMERLQPTLCRTVRAFVVVVMRAAAPGATQCQEGQKCAVCTGGEANGFHYCMCFDLCQVSTDVLIPGSCLQQQQLLFHGLPLAASIVPLFSGPERRATYCPSPWNQNTSSTLQHSRHQQQLRLVPQVLHIIR
jgi:hypothetical protein